MEQLKTIQDNPENFTGDNPIDAIYHSFIQTKEYCEFLSTNEFNIDWLKSKLSGEDFYKLENDILGYVSRNDKLTFSAGFKYAWRLFHECGNAECLPKSKS